MSGRLAPCFWWLLQRDASSAASHAFPLPPRLHHAHSTTGAGSCKILIDATRSRHAAVGTRGDRELGSSERGTVADDTRYIFALPNVVTIPLRRRPLPAHSSGSPSWKTGLIQKGTTPRGLAPRRGLSQELVSWPSMMLEHGRPWQLGPYPSRVTV